MKKQQLPLLIILCLCIFSTCFANTEYVPGIAIYEAKEQVGISCARNIVDLIVKNNEQKLPTVLGLATGSTPIPVYQAFKKIVKEEGIDLSKVMTFNLDEYQGLPQTHPESYHHFMFLHLFDDLVQSQDNMLGIPLENIHIPNGYAKEEKDLTIGERNALLQHFPFRFENSPLTEEEEIWILSRRAEDYEAVIQILGPIDLQILGIGTNGHIGFAEPGSSFVGKTMLVKLTENTRHDNARFFDNIVEEVPSYAISMGIGTILQAKEIYLLATGRNKAEIVAKTLEEAISSAIPSTALRLHPRVMFYLDSEAAAKTNQKTFSS